MNSEDRCHVSTAHSSRPLPFAGPERLVGVAASQVDAVFLTHLHSDHIVGIPDLWCTGWLQRNKPWPLFGPSGTARMMDALKLAFSVDIHARVEETAGLLTPAGSEVKARDIEPGLVYERNGLRVTLARVKTFHVDPSEAGSVFRRVRPKLAVYSHVILRGVSTEDLVKRTRTTYTGPLVVGEDLMRFVVGEDVAIYRR